MLVKTYKLMVYGQDFPKFEVKVSQERPPKYTIGDTKIIEDTYGWGDYKVKTTGRIILTVSVPETDNYNAVSKKITITVKPQKPKGISLSSKKKKNSVKWDKDDQVSGYELQYSTDRKFKTNKKTVTKSGKNKNSTIINGKKNKTYYVRVRSYKTSNGTKIYGAWTRIKNKKCK